MLLKKYVSSFLVVFMISFSSVFTPIQTARAIAPLLLGLTATELTAAATLLIAGGLTYTNRDAIASTAHKFLETLPDIDRKTIQDAALTGSIYVTASLFSKLKSYIDSWNYTEGQKLDYFNPNDYGTINYTSAGNKATWTFPAPQGSFAADHWMKNNSSVNNVIYFKSNYTSSYSYYVSLPYGTEVIGSTIYRYYKVQVKDPFKSAPIYDSGLIKSYALGSQMPFRIDILGSTMTLYIAGTQAFTMNDTSGNLRFSHRGSLYSDNSNELRNAHYLVDSTYLFKGAEAVLDRQVLQAPGYDLTSKSFRYQKTGLGIR
ncbi:hypothetical protein [Effusibacillus consociatus]|uniref:Uncharacterized protein n=1 Tax=Effusibacillus consociatus TaxID=1117041 RepID=A0ABV9PYK0_9BACL